MALAPRRKVVDAIVLADKFSHWFLITRYQIVDDEDSTEIQYRGGRAVELTEKKRARILSILCSHADAEGTAQQRNCRCRDHACCVDAAIPNFLLPIGRLELTGTTFELQLPAPFRLIVYNHLFFYSIIHAIAARRP